MTQPTAVVLDPDQNRRDEIRMRLSHCGVLPICFDDEWICLENILHVRPAFAVCWPASGDVANHFICMARAIEITLPIIIISDQQDLLRTVCRPWVAGLHFIGYPVVETALQTLVESFIGLHMQRVQPMLIAESPFFRQCLNPLSQIGLSKEPLLIQGEPGVGKKLIAGVIQVLNGEDQNRWRSISAREISGAWIHGLHRRIDRLPPSDSPRRCYVIENLEELDDQLQSQLLLVMDALSAKRNGNGAGAPIRFIFLADCNLSAQSHGGQFRKDLYYRCTVLKISVPPLRDRREDIPLLAEFFAAKYGLETQGSLVRLPEDIRTAFREYHWPGNVAQLETTINHAMANGGDAWADALRQWCREHTTAQPFRFTSSVIDVDGYLRKLIDNQKDLSLKTARQSCVMEMEKDILKTALLKTHGNCKKAASLLNISYKSMLTKVKAYRLVGRSL